jgi:hypothetical protein
MKFRNSKIPSLTALAWLASGLLGLTLTAPTMADDSKTQRPVLLELFTSQGCSSCPPADALLKDLSAQADVLPLAFHVDYWDYIGWADPFASPAFTARQQNYARHRGFEVYTPQLVIDGRSAIVGSNRGGAGAGIAQAKAAVKSAPATISRNGNDVSITVGTASNGGAAVGNVYLVSFDGSQTTAIKKGENAGRNIVYANIVRSMRPVGEWHNAPLKLTEQLRPNEKGERLALIVQSDNGDVWAVASTPALQKTASRDY